MKNSGNTAVQIRLFASAVVAGLIVLTLSSAAHAGGHDVVRATLANGLRIVIVPDRLAPVVTTSVNYLVGADETPAGFPGMAHAQEHMMFRGSPGLSADQLADLGSVMGGRFNADTRQTVTQYYFTVPAEDLDVALHIEALRMAGTLDTEADWDRERGAIEQEVAQDISNPDYVLYTKLRAAFFNGTPYAHDALGTRASFDKTSGKMLKEFFDKWYAPNNALLVVAGDVDAPATLAKIKTLFGPLARKTLPPRPDVTPPPVKARRFHLDTDLPYSQVVLALRMPGLDSPDFPAVELLSDVLNSQRGALYDLVPQGKALTVGFSFEPLPKAGLGYAEVTFETGGNTAEHERELRTILGKIAAHGVPPELVAAAKLQERREAQFQRNSIEGLASVWSEAIAVYGLDNPDDDLARIEKVTVADVDRVAREYLDLDRAVTAVLTPRRGGKPITAAGFGGQENIALGAAHPTSLPDWAQPAVRRLGVPASHVHPHVTRLANGITLIVQPEDVSDTVSVYGEIRNRPEVEVPKGKEGLGSLTDDLFSYGSEKLDRLAFQRALDDIGAAEHAGTRFGVQVLADHFDRAVALLADNELHPAFPAPAFEIVKREEAQSVAGELKSPSYLSHRALRVALFPKTDPTLRQALPETIAALTLRDVREYYREAFRPDLATIVVIGKISPERAKATIEKYFGAWTAAGPVPATDLPPAPINAASTIAVPDADRVQDTVTLSEVLELNRANPAYYALQLGNTVLGGGFYSTRLTRDLRKDMGLVYYVGSEFEVGTTRGVYFVEYACDPQNVSRVHQVVVRELQEMQNTNPTDEELSRAKAYLLRQIPLEEADVGGIAHGLLARVDLRLPLDEPTRAARQYLRLSGKDVRTAFAKWLRPKGLVRVSQGPAPH